MQWPEAAAETRVDTWVEPGTEVTPFYDPLLAKLIVHGDSRADALRKMKAALDQCRIAGIETNLSYGDVLHLGDPPAAPQAEHRLSATAIPSYPHLWEIGVLYGPHGAADFFTHGDMERFFDTGWKVHYNSDRTSVRLLGPKPTWARKDGGEAGLHPSNIHDNAYAEYPLRIAQPLGNGELGSC